MSNEFDMARRTTKDLTQEQLKELLHYDPDTGVFTWNKSRQGVKKGTIAGGLSNGYVLIEVKTKDYLAHRLAFLYMDGYFPEHHVDHINRLRADNRWCNLRHVSNQCNTRNSNVYNTNTSGVTGISFNSKTCKFESSITVDYKKISLGAYDDIGDAAKARWEGEVRYDFPNCNTTSSAYLYLKDNGLIDKDTEM